MWDCFTPDCRGDAHLCVPRGSLLALPRPVGCVVDSIETYKAEVLLVLPNSLYLRGVQNRFIRGHALLCLFLVLFLGTDLKNQDGEHHREMMVSSET